ncbi:hypothetical protein BDV26DRAFT_155851 [Aspergillus bertholletiae]|uniref:Uncharacterized protein n=1 Tax=Aspergillus bertholletiae TaxID=1226010 RepID=A0A5N7AQI7_9EURO|nr:hypothetical protein BDV26DRAFT_155851 [Aspergillus bertholletiae]
MIIPQLSSVGYTESSTKPFLAIFNVLIYSLSHPFSFSCFTAPQVWIPSGDPPPRKLRRLREADPQRVGEPALMPSRRRLHSPQLSASFSTPPPSEAAVVHRTRAPSCTPIRTLYTPRNGERVLFLV